MHGSPCQSFSLAGKQEGGDKGSGTRSSLMWETIRIVEKLKPKYVIWENVKNLLSKKHRHNFDAYLETMEQLGYTNYYQVLNAKDYLTPQNRERVFTISIRKDINKIFTFPKPIPLKLKLKDLLEEEVDEKYYLSDEMLNNISYVSKKYNEFLNEKGYIPEMLNPYNKTEIKDVAPTQSTQCGSSTSSSTVLLKSKCKRLKSLIDKTEFEEGKVLNMDLYNQTTNENISQCLTEPHHNSQRLFDGLRIRKLTPKECWRLMGFTDEEFEKASQVNSNTQLYKQAGNSICVPVLIAILNNLLKGD